MRSIRMPNARPVRVWAISCSRIETLRPRTIRIATDRAAAAPRFLNSSLSCQPMKSANTSQLGSILTSTPNSRIPRLGSLKGNVIGSLLRPVRPTPRPLAFGVGIRGNQTARNLSLAVELLNANISVAGDAPVIGEPDEKLSHLDQPTAAGRSPSAAPGRLRLQQDSDAGQQYAGQVGRCAEPVPTSRRPDSQPGVDR